MSDILLSIFAGIIQGLTEFLPVSSSGHLVLFHSFFNFNFADNLAFDVVLHLGTLVAIVGFFFSDIVALIKAFFLSFVKFDLKSNTKQLLAWYLFIATIPAVIVGFFLEEQIDIIFRNTGLVAWMLIIFGILLYLADKYFKKVNTIDNLKFKSALTIGLFQAVALIPGVSRSGITIIAGLSQKLKREEAAKFSFLLATPIVFGAGLKKIIDLNSVGLGMSDFWLLIIGFIASTVTGYFCIKYFLEFLKNHSLAIFAYYRILLGILILILMMFE